MEDTSGNLNIRDYLQIGLRRKWWVIIPFIASLFIAAGVYVWLPKIYEAKAVVIVQPQAVPESYVKTTISASMMDRLNTINQEIKSRTTLEKVIRELDLYQNNRRKYPMEEIVETMRRAISVNLVKGLQTETRSRSDQAQQAFSISYEGEDPQVVMAVTNRIVSIFIEENLKIRESQAGKTADFLTAELKKLEDELAKKERDISAYKQRHMGQLPGQLDANLRILERLQQQIKTTSESIRAAEDRSILYQGQIEQLKKVEAAIPAPPPQPEEPVQTLVRPAPKKVQEDPIVTQYNNLRRDLENAQSKYRENHPDVIDLKRKIANLEPKARELMNKQKAEEEAAQQEVQVSRPVPPQQQRGLRPERDPAMERLINDYTEKYNAAVLEGKRLRDEERKIKEQINQYQARIETTPQREQELALLTRDYDLLKNNYQSLMDKNIQSQMAENLERRQQGEQFKILDPARLPEKPIRPDRNRILLIGAALGLLGGLGLSFLRETWNQKFHTEAEVEQTLGIPVIAVIPNLKEDKAA